LEPCLAKDFIRACKVDDLHSIEHQYRDTGGCLVGFRERAHPKPGEEYWKSDSQHGGMPLIGEEASTLLLKKAAAQHESLSRDEVPPICGKRRRTVVSGARLAHRRAYRGNCGSLAARCHRAERARGRHCPWRSARERSVVSREWSGG